MERKVLDTIINSTFPGAVKSRQEKPFYYQDIIDINMLRIKATVYINRFRTYESGDVVISLHAVRTDGSDVPLWRIKTMGPDRTMRAFRDLKSNLLGIAAALLQICNVHVADLPPPTTGPLPEDPPPSNADFESVLEGFDWR